MAVDMHEPESTAQLVKGILRDTRELVKEHVALLRDEIREEVQQSKIAVVKIGLGAAAAVGAGILMIFMAAHGLHAAVPGLPLWAAFGICAAVLAIIAGALLFWGRSEFPSFGARLRQVLDAPPREKEPWMNHPT